MRTRSHRWGVGRKGRGLAGAREGACLGCGYGGFGGGAFGDGRGRERRGPWGGAIQGAQHRFQPGRGGAGGAGRCRGWCSAQAAPRSAAGAGQPPALGARRSGRRQTQHQAPCPNLNLPTHPPTLLTPPPRGQVVIVCEPEGSSLMMGGLHPRGSLFERPVNIESARAHHANFRQARRGGEGCSGGQGAGRGTLGGRGEGLPGSTLVAAEVAAAAVERLE